MIKVKKISYRYPKGPEVFRDISLQLKPGEVVGIYGKSGLGKTTLAKLIAGYLQPNSGQIEIDGKKPLSKGRNPVQLIWQHPEQAINPRWRMEKVLLEAGKIDSDLLEDLKIRKNWLHRYPSELSGGELQRFCMARALHPDTNYIIADEMTTMLDAITQVQIWQTLIKMVKQRSIGVLSISHNQELLGKISDRIIDFNNLVKQES